MFKCWILLDECEKELKLLQERVDSFSWSSIFDSVKERDIRLNCYENMDFCDDFEKYCDYFELPFHKFGEVHGANMLKNYIKCLKNQEQENSEFKYF